MGPGWQAGPGFGATPAGISIFLCGDVMLGRGLDQALPVHCEPTLHESHLTDAREYLALAEQAHGPFPRPLRPADVWGEALAELERAQPDVRLINLETSITTSERFWWEKEIHYRMHPGNAAVLTAARIDCCSLANNHVLDWGYAGLEETLETLRAAGVRSCGAGRNEREARAPASLEVPGRGRVLVLACASDTSGVPETWAAGPARPGVNLLDELSASSGRRLGEELRQLRLPGDVLVVSIHWGPNWGYEVTEGERSFAHALVDAGGADLVHGHSSHHVKGIEVYRERLILYGCGDFLDDYEGISGWEAYRGDLGLMFFARVDSESGRLASLELVPTHIRRFRVERASADEGRWLAAVLDREGGRFGTSVSRGPDGRLTLRW